MKQFRQVPAQSVCARCASLFVYFRRTKARMYCAHCIEPLKDENNKFYNTWAKVRTHAGRGRGARGKSMTLPAIRHEQQVSRFTPDQTDLIKRTIRDEQSGCLIWTGHKHTFGYGLIFRNNKTEYVHRVIIDAPSGLVVRHACDNPACINPEHLSLGTQADNIADAVKRNRIARGNKLPQSKLTPELAEAIRLEYAAGGVSQEALGKKYGVHQVRISQVVRGKTWAKN